MSHDLSHPTARHRDVVQRRAVRAQRGHGRRGSLVNRDVIGMAVEAVFAEGNHHVWTKPADGAADVGFEPLRLSPGQHAVLVIEQHQIGYAEDTRGVPQFLKADAANICWSWPELSRSGATDRHASAQVGAPGKQPSTRQRLVVWMCKDSQKRACAQVVMFRLHRRTFCGTCLERDAASRA